MASLYFHRDDNHLASMTMAMQSEIRPEYRTGSIRIYVAD